MADKQKPEEELVFVRYIRHWRTGKIIYPKNGKFFVFPAKKKR